MSWLETQVVIGLLMAGWQAYAWRWAAPAVRVEARRVQRTPAKGQTYVRETDPGVKIISGGGAAASTKEENSNA